MKLEKNMNLSTHLSIGSFKQWIRFDRVNITRQAAIEPILNSARVTISPQAGLLSKSSSTIDLDSATLDRVETVAQLKNAVQGADFRSMSPRDTASLASALDRTGQFDNQATTNFFISLNIDTPLSLDTKVDVVEHFGFMLKNAQEGARTDSDFAAAVQIREKGSHLLDTLISSAQSSVLVEAQG